MDDTTADPDRPCQHLHFLSRVAVGRIMEDEGSTAMPKAYVAEVTVHCAPEPDGCGEQFRFSGVPAGLSFEHPMVSADEAELRAPIRPSSADPDFGLGVPGLAIQQVPVGAPPIPLPGEPAPGDPTPGELASADQKLAGVRVMVDELVAAASTGAPVSTEAWINFAYHDVIDAVTAAAGDSSREGDFEAIVLGALAESVFRLAGRRGQHG